MKKLALTKSAYHSARICASKHLFFTQEQIDKLLGLSFHEILRFMQEHSFKESIDKTYTEYEGFYLIETLLNDHASAIYERIIHAAPKNNKQFLDAYYLKYQIHNLMCFLRCRLAKEENFEVYLIGDRRKKDKFLKAYQMTNITDGISYICSKLNFDTAKVLEKYSQDMFTLENYLYKTYYEKLVATTYIYNRKDEKLFFMFTKRYIDLINARTFLKFENEKHLDLFADLFLPGGNIPLRFFQQLEKDSTDNKAKKISNELTTRYGFPPFEQKIELDGTIIANKQDASKMLSKISFGSPFYALRFLFAFEKQIAQLRVILKGKYLGIEKKDIEALL